MNNEELQKLKALAHAATPQNLDSAEDSSVPEGCIECPECGGEGAVELTADYCNYDGKALGVQFYGIGPEHRAAEAFFRAANPAAVLELIAMVEAGNPASVPVSAGTIDTPHINNPDINAVRRAYVEAVYRAEQAEAELSKLRASNDNVIEAAVIFGMAHYADTKTPVPELVSKYMAEVERAATAPVSAVPSDVDVALTLAGRWKERAVKAEAALAAGAPVSAAEDSDLRQTQAETAGGQELPALPSDAEIFEAAQVHSIGGSDHRVLAFARDILAMRQPQGDDKSRNWPDYNDDSRIDFTLKKGDTVYSQSWGDGVKPLEIIDTNWALRAVAVRLAKDGAIVVWPVAGLSRVAAKQAGKEGAQ